MDASSAETELAIVEDDLMRFDALNARETIQLRTSELADVEQRLNKNHEELGSLKQEIKLLESGRDSHAEFFRKSRVATEIYRASEDWLALQIEYAAVMQIRRRFEQENISGTLVTASGYMHRMTSGRYHRI